ncbi:specific transcriptional repressor [Rhizophagus clarus]|uniref:Specific transcriptional repressor n=1 Tax=Rhizophagus clarus TaxID=94130 RepID=A0A8H3L4J6_9GLOM|nr:specific transcriptional repressor [Rhizophagus clarus]
MSTQLDSNSWQNRLVSSKGEFPTLKQQKIIEENFQRKDIFEHEYSVDDLFKQFYKVSTEESHKVNPKRQPNAFMILRAVLGLVASDKKIKSKIGDGTEQSRLASFIWGGASENERNKFDEMCSEFKRLHRRLYPNYIYKPNPRNTKVGSVVDIKTAESYQIAAPSTDVSVPMVPVDHSFQTYIPEEMDIKTSDLDQQTFFEGYFPYNLQNAQYNYPSISVNCPDLNDSLASSFSVNADPISYPFGGWGLKNIL